MDMNEFARDNDLARKFEKAIEILDRGKGWEVFAGLDKGPVTVVVIFDGLVRFVAPVKKTPKKKARPKKVVKPKEEEPPGTDESEPETPPCLEGYHWDPHQEICVPDGQGPHTEG